MFHFPVSEEEVPDYRSVIHKPMDMATVLQRVDSGQYLTRTAFMKDIDLIVSNAKVYFLGIFFTIHVIYVVASVVSVLRMAA